MITLPTGLDEAVYPLAWLSGEYTGSGKMGGNFGVADTVFESTAKWVPSGSQMNYELLLTTADGKEKILSEKGVWKVAKERPETLTDEQQFPLDIEIETTFYGLSTGKTGKKAEKIAQKTAQKTNQKTWTSRYVGIIGHGKAEILADEIDLHNTDVKIGDFRVNDLYRSKRMYGYVNNRILWAWDVALIGGTTPESFAAGSLVTI